jgi:ATP-dependent DNA ligase
MSLPLDLVSCVSRRMVRGTTWDLASPSQEHPWRKRAKLYCGSGNDLTYRFPVIVEALARLRSRSCTIDGEAVACSEDGIACFDHVRYRRHDGRVFLYAFDLIELDGG